MTLTNCMCLLCYENDRLLLYSFISRLLYLLTLNEMDGITIYKYAWSSECAYCNVHNGSISDQWIETILLWMTVATSVQCLLNCILHAMGMKFIGLSQSYLICYYFVFIAKVESQFAYYEQWVLGWFEWNVRSSSQNISSLYSLVVMHFHRCWCYCVDSMLFPAILILAPHTRSFCHLHITHEILDSNSF